MANETKVIILYILKILSTYSDENHYLTQKEIIEYLKNEYDVIVERKAVSRNLAVLEELGFGICTTRSGSFLQERLFDDSELRLLIDGVLSSRYINEPHSYDLIQKLSNLSSKYFKKRIKHVYAIKDFSKTDNQELFLNIEMIDEAINNNRQIKCTYYKYGTDKKLHKSSTLILSPYQFILHNQRYYLMACHMKWQHMGYYRMDHIKNIKVLSTPRQEIRDIPGYENGINYKDLSSYRPYMFSDKPVEVTSLTEEWMIDQVIDWFGKDIQIQKHEDKILITLKTSPEAMEYWAMQYANYIEVITPKTLRNKIKDNLKNALEKYGE